MKNQWRVILAMFLVLVIVFFAIMNGTPVPISYGFGEVKWPLILVVLVAVIFGAVITALVSTSAHLKKRSVTKAKAKEYETQLAEKDKKIEVKEEEIQDYQARLSAKEQAFSELQEKVASGILDSHQEATTEENMSTINEESTENN